MFEDNLLKSTFISGRFPPRPADQSKSSGINQRSTFSNEITGFNGPQAPRPHKVPPRCVPCDGGGSFNPMLSSTPSSAIYAQAEISKGQPDYSQWLLNPAAPAVVADHLRTGRSNNLKSNLLTDRSSGVSYMDQALHQALRNKLRASILTPPSKSNFPQTLGPYLLVNPLEGASTPRVSEALELPTQCFKAWSPRLSMPVVLRRVLPERLEPLPSEAYFLARQFCDASDPSVIQLRDVVPVDEFGDNSVIFVYDFLPCCYTLQQIHMSDPAKSSGELPPSDLLPERTAWMFLVQLTQALRFAHQTLNRSVGVLHPSKILVQDGTRLFVNCIGLKDVINHSTMANTMAELKARDFVALGKLMLGVIFGTPLAMKKPTQYLSILEQVFPQGLPNLLQDLLTGTLSSVDALVLATANHAYDHLSTICSVNKYQERQLLRELENGRLFRLICKLNSVVERHDTRRLDHREPEWSETGDRYMLKLFRDFVFHQVDQRGAPHLDLAHIVTVLNKVEAASQERLCLVSRKGERAIIVTYADIRHWLDTSFGSLVEEHRRSLFEQQMVQQQEQQQADAENNGSGVNPTEAI
uniref:Pan3_PK domain-containing protein n=1 Tax=Mesocestoides corti TaxID=53468 RepID=A0A5K3EHB4_MESCO